jgi:hypothetical protein
VYFVQLGVARMLTKKVVGVFVRFSCASASRLALFSICAVPRLMLTNGVILLNRLT